MSDPYEYVRKHYNVPAHPGRRVKDEHGVKGTVVQPRSGTTHSVHVVLDGQRDDAPYHPRSLTYLGDDEPPAPPVVAKPTEWITAHGKRVDEDPWMTEASRIVINIDHLKLATIITGSSMAREVWESYDLGDRLEGLPVEPGLYQATLQQVIWAGEGDSEFFLHDVSKLAPAPQPGWAKHQCQACKSNAVLPWPSTTDLPEAKRYRCIDCGSSTTIDPRPEPYYGRCAQDETAWHAYGTRGLRCENGHIEPQGLAIVPQPRKRPPQAPYGKQWCMCPVYHGFAPHAVEAPPKEAIVV